MNMTSRTVITACLALACSPFAHRLMAQDTAATPNSDLAQCVKWLTATVSEKIALDPTAVCSGVKKGDLGEWITEFGCGPKPEALNSTPRYCATWGEIRPSRVWAVGYSSSTKYGSDLLDETSNIDTDPQHAGATFYSTMPMLMENLSMPAGMYKLIPVKAPDGWKLKVVKQDSEAADTAQRWQSLGIVDMKAREQAENLERRYLSISTDRRALGCPGPNSRLDLQELHFTYESTDVYVCVHPGLVGQDQQASFK